MKQREKLDELAWGYNYHGQLGDGTTINKYVPTRIGIGND